MAWRLIRAAAKVNAVDRYGSTALHGAISKQAVQVLLASGAAVNARDREGRTPLMTCFMDDICTLLLESGADPTLRNRYGRTALDFAQSPSKKALLERHSNR